MTSTATPVIFQKPPTFRNSPSTTNRFFHYSLFPSPVCYRSANVSQSSLSFTNHMRGSSETPFLYQLIRTQRYTSPSLLTSSIPYDRLPLPGPLPCSFYISYPYRRVHSGSLFLTVLSFFYLRHLYTSFVVNVDSKGAPYNRTVYELMLISISHEWFSKSSLPRTDRTCFLPRNVYFTILS